MRLSLIVGLYNMVREIPRTVLTMASHYQQLPADQYEIILVDNGSTNRPDQAQLHALASNLRYVYVDDAMPSPTGALNEAVQSAQGELVTVVIDGARMLSPGILRQTLQAFRAFDDPFVYAPSLHLGPQLQNDSSYGGYDQMAEDELLASVEWEEDGYELFGISNIAAVPERLLRPTFESNCFTIRRSTWDRIGGYHPGFAAAVGGGVANWELFARYMADATITPVLLAGEATFHQFHGGAATNTPRAGHPVRGWLRDHRTIVGRPYQWPDYQPTLFGRVSPKVGQHLFESNSVAHAGLARELSASGQHNAAIAVSQHLCDRFPHDPGRLMILAECLDRAGRRDEALAVIDDALAIAPTQAELHVSRGIIQVGRGHYDLAYASYTQALELDDILPAAFFHRGHLRLREQRLDEAIQDFERAMEIEPNPPDHFERDLLGARELRQSEPERVRIGELEREFVASVQRHYGDALEAELIDAHARPGSSSVTDLAALHRLLRSESPTRMLLVGGFLGLSTRVAVEATEPAGSSIVCVDPNLRHRVFSTPLNHARAIVQSDRVTFVDGFFGARTAAGSLFDLQTYEPVHSEPDAQEAVEQVPLAGDLGLFDFVLLDSDLGTETQLMAAALDVLDSDGSLAIVGRENQSAAQLLTHGTSDGSFDVASIDGDRGLVVIRKHGG